MSRSKHKIQLISDLGFSSPISEAFKSLRTNIEYSNLGDEIKTLMVTCSQLGEGKSSVAANLAIAYAHSGKKVVLLDLDLRQPSQHKNFQLSNDFGISTMLSQQTSLKNILIQTEVENLTIIPSGPLLSSPSEMLASSRMRDLLVGLKQDFEILIIDSPAVLTSSDSQIISTMSDGVLLVVESGKVKKDALLKAKQSLELVKARILGVILNNVDKSNLVS